jgi:hypothetical protein
MEAKNQKNAIIIELSLLPRAANVILMVAIAFVRRCRDLVI